MIAAALAISAGACAPGEVSGENALPNGIPDPASVQTPAGALAFYHRVVATIPQWLDPLIVDAGVFTDELADLPLSLFVSWTYTNLDSRTDVASVGEGHYNALHRVRAQAREARGFLQSYVTDTADTAMARELRGHLYALEGYAEVFLADLFCSGIPLSTVDYGTDYTLAAGSTTAQVYTHAVTLFDTALALLRDSVDLRYLTQVGQGRALLALGEYAQAATAVAAVPDAYGYRVVSQSDASHGEIMQSFTGHNNGGQYGPGTPSVGDREGFNGLDYRSSHDPRTPAALLGQDADGNDLYFPAKYPQEGPVTFLLADGIEARLIEAEAALRASADDGQWLVKLNALRTDGTYELLENGDTLWHRGTGGVDSLAPLPDPGPTDPRARVDLLFRERAFWLYLTGHRQGDLRRLIRQYNRDDPETVYPTGPYAGLTGTYGTAVVFPVPASERRLNPKYTGCVNDGA